MTTTEGLTLVDWPPADTPTAHAIRHCGELDKITPALVKAQASAGGVDATGRNDYDRYDYSTLKDYIAASKGALLANDIAMVSGTQVLNRDQRKTNKGGTEYVVYTRTVVTLIHESGQWIEATVDGEGQDRADKAVWKAITGARKYAIASLLNIYTGDDPEADETVGTTPAAAESGTREVPQAPPTTKGRTDSVAELKQQVNAKFQDWVGGDHSEVKAAIQKARVHLEIPTSGVLGKAHVPKLADFIDQRLAEGVPPDQFFQS